MEYITVTSFSESVFCLMRPLLQGEVQYMAEILGKMGHTAEDALQNAEQTVRNNVESMLSGKCFGLRALAEDGKWVAMLVADKGNLGDCHVIYAVYEGVDGGSRSIISAYLQEQGVAKRDVFCQPLKENADMISLLRELGFEPFEFPRDWIVLPLDRDPFSVVMRHAGGEND